MNTPTGIFASASRYSSNPEQFSSLDRSGTPLAQLLLSYCGQHAAAPTPTKPASVRSRGGDATTEAPPTQGGGNPVSSGPQSVNPISSGPVESPHSTEPADDTQALGIEDPAVLDGASDAGWDAIDAQDLSVGDRSSTGRASVERGSDERAAAEDRAELFVVGVGASAGGLDALEQFFGAMPEDTGMAFVVVQHLSPDFKSVMDELLARRTNIPVVLVEDGMRVETNRIYLIPPKKEMIVSGGKLLLSDKGATQGLMLPIDLFFRSLAEDMGERAIGIVLSGAGSDGARGIRDIHEAGGLVLCQDERSAYFDGMPRSARETGVVDFVLPPAQMPSALARARARSRRAPASARAGAQSRRALMASLPRCASCRTPTASTSRTTNRRRSSGASSDVCSSRSRARSRRTSSGSAHDTAELDDLFHDLLIGVTRFFRDEGAFECLEETHHPRAGRARATDRRAAGLGGGLRHR